MDLGEILSDAFVYPLNNIKVLVIYIILGIIAAIVGGTAIFTAVGASMTKGVASAGLDIISVVGIIVFLIIFLLIEGYCLDVIKYGINRDPGAPGIDFARQVINAIKLFVVEFVYYIIPVILLIILLVLFGNGLIGLILTIIVGIVFTLALIMAICRLANTDSLGEALAIGEAIGDISRVGFLNLILLIIIFIVVAFIALFIAGLIANLNGTVGSIILGIFMVYLTFVVYRAIGLLYSNA